MQFRVPQFIEVEDKLIGPLTFKQFIYVVGSGAMAFVIYSLMPVKFLGIIFGLPALAFGIGLAFVQVNNKPLVFTLEAAFNYFRKNRLYIWKKVPKKGVVKKVEEEVEEEETSFVPRLSQSKLKELSWGLDVYDSEKQSPDDF